MPKPDIDAIRDRLGKATPGPWEWQTDDWNGGYSGLAAGSDASVNVLYPDHCNEGDSGAAWFSEDTLSAADASLIAHAPADLAALLEYAERLEAALVAIKAMPDTNQQGLYMVGYNTALNTAWHIADRALKGESNA